jgi:hypothetical protein
MLTIVESPNFARHWPQYWKKADYAAFIEFIVNSPNAGTIVPHTGGLRKIRWARPGVGKSRGVRVIYFTKDAEGKLILLTIYAKAATSNLTAAKLKELRRDYEKIITPQ